MPKSALVALLVAGVFLPPFAFADDATRQIQEELRRRHLYYSDIDGRNTADVSAALKKFQERQGFAATGLPDDQTLQSLGILTEPAPPADGGVEVLPDIPVLRSDSAPQNREATAPAQPVSLPQMKSAPPTRKEVREFVRKYFAACASPNIHDELAFYADRVSYFDHGVVDRSYIQNELAAYDQRWTRRKYTVGNSIAVVQQRDRMTARFNVAFQIANGPTERKASGQTSDSLGITRRPDSTLGIVSIEEARVTRSSRARQRRRGRAPLVGDPVVHSVQKAFRGIFGGRRR